MAIVVYKCDTCKREVELQRKPKGVETVGRCVITHGCRGKLYQTDLLEDFIRGSIPDPVVGLDDWHQRIVLYNHTQTLEREEWLIEHGMGIIPAVTALIEQEISGVGVTDIEITPDDTIIIDDDTIKLVFDRPRKGKAQLLSVQSDPDLLNPLIRTTTETTEPIQISNLGEITIATRVEINQVPDPVVSMSLLFNTTDNFQIPELYAADDNPSLNSPWNGSQFRQLIINVKSRRQLYITRSFTGLTPSFTTGVINSGSSFVFAGIDTTGTGDNIRDIETGEVLILLASRPYATVDKIFDQYIDVTDVTDTNNQFGFFYNNGEFFADVSIIQSVFPPITNVE